VDAVCRYLFADSGLRKIGELPTLYLCVEVRFVTLNVPCEDEIFYENAPVFALTGNG